MAYTTINKSTVHFNTLLYTGNSGTQTKTGVGFKPDLTWIKQRTASPGNTNNVLYDAVRGAYWTIQSNTNAAQSADDGLVAWNSDGFNIGNVNTTNYNNSTYAAWNWKANGSGSSNTAGSINSTVSVNTTAGFSIVKFTGTGSNATVGHGLGVVPKMIMLKKTNGSADWIVYHNSMGNTKALKLNSNAALSTDSGYFNSATPTSTLFSLGNDGFTNGSNAVIIAYCFAEKQGYSKFGSYIGNGNANGTFIYTGLKPSTIILKPSTYGDQWMQYDNKRLGYNDYNNFLSPSTANGESTGHGSTGAIDILSNGFKARSTGNSLNKTGETYIYMAIGQSLVGTNNVPCTAR